MDESEKTPNLEGLDPARLMALADEARSIAAEAAGPAPGRARPRIEPWPVERVDAMFPNLEVLELVGAGGMGAVYRARQSSLGRDVALKLLHPELASEPGLADRFTREARALASLSHPNIVAVHAVGVTDGVPWLVMEFVPGVTLREALRTGELTSADALSLVGPMCDALQYAHDVGVVHRDVKPENVLLDGRGGIKIADFGLAKLLGTDDDHTLTATHQVMGTPRYMAPEQFDRPRDVDHRADIYSLGVVVYEMLTGHVPAGRFVPPSVQAAVDARVDEIVMRALEREPWQRYQQAADVKTDVDALGTAPPPRDDAPQAEPPRRRWMIEGREWTDDDQREEWRDVGQLMVVQLGALLCVGASAFAFRFGELGLVAAGVVISLAYGAWSVARLRRHEPRLAEGWRAKTRFARTSRTAVAAGLVVLGWVFGVLGVVAGWEEGVLSYAAPTTGGFVTLPTSVVNEMDPFEGARGVRLLMGFLLVMTAGSVLLDMQTPSIRRTRELLLAWTPAIGAAVALILVSFYTTIATTLDQPWPLYEVEGEVSIDAPVRDAQRQLRSVIGDDYVVEHERFERAPETGAVVQAEVVLDPRWPTDRWNASGVFVLRDDPTLRLRLLPDGEGVTRVEWSVGSYPAHNGQAERQRIEWTARFEDLAAR